MEKRDRLSTRPDEFIAARAVIFCVIGSLMRSMTLTEALIAVMAFLVTYRRRS